MCKVCILSFPLGRIFSVHISSNRPLGFIALDFYGQQLGRVRLSNVNRKMRCFLNFGGCFMIKIPSTESSTQFLSDDLFANDTESDMNDD